MSRSVDIVAPGFNYTLEREREKVLCPEWSWGRKARRRVMVVSSF